MSLYQGKAPDQPSFTFSYSGLSHTGLIRERNEDSFICLPEQHLWVVADGMGGHDAGDFASQTITEQAGKFSQQATLEDSILLLEENLLHSNQLIQQKARDVGLKTTIGSTVACLYAWKNLAFTLWAGDSRLYRYRNHKLTRLTEDHSYVEELVKLGKIEAAEAEDHPASNVVLNAIGIEDNLVIDIEYYEILHKDVFVLCSDGLYKDLSDDRIAGILGTPDASLEQINQRLVDAALEVGGSDNCTVVLIQADIVEHNA